MNLHVHTLKIIFNIILHAKTVKTNQSKEERIGIVEICQTVII